MFRKDTMAWELMTECPWSWRDAMVIFGLRLRFGLCGGGLRAVLWPW